MSGTPTDRLPRHRPHRRRPGWAASLLGLALSGAATAPPGAVAAEALATVVIAPAPVPDPAAIPVNVDFDLTILRHRPGTPVTDDQIAACQDFEQLHRLLRTSGRPEILHRARQHVVCQPAARIRFAAGESRSAFPLVAGADVPPPRAYGVELAIDLRVITTESAGPGAMALAWSGSWSGSTQVLSRWEALALRGFTLARTVPGVTYEKSEPDEDGFVNTSGSTDISSLFRRRRKNKAVDRKAATVSATVSATAPAAAAAAPGTPTEHEPSYFSGAVVERVQFTGDTLCSGNGLVVRRESLPGSPDAGQILLVIAPLIRP